MTRKLLFIAILILLGSGTALLLRRAARPTRENIPLSTPEGHSGVRQHPLSAEEKLRLHPLASKEKLALAKQTPVSTWDEWRDAHTEIMVAQLIITGWADVDTPEEVAACRQKIRQGSPGAPMSGLSRESRKLQSRACPTPEISHSPAARSMGEIVRVSKKLPRSPNARSSHGRI